MTITAILFDLDGTLLDTAADLALALNKLLSAYQYPTVPLEELKPHISQGSTGMLQKTFDMDVNDGRFNGLRQQFLHNYRQNIRVHTQPYPGIEQLIEELDARQLPWGVVTNKTESLATTLLSHFPFAQRCGCIVGCDTLAKAKPHPEPLWHACNIIERKPEECIYVGDAARDIEAGQRAGMHTVVASYGYIPHDHPPTTWGADTIIQHPEELLALIG
jgi:2-phosphoglycolate phosphatase